MATKPQQGKVVKNVFLFPHAFSLFFKCLFLFPHAFSLFSSVSERSSELVISWHNIGDGGVSRFYNDHFGFLLVDLAPGLLPKVSPGPCSKTCACPWPRIVAFMQEDVSDVILWMTFLVESCRYPRVKSLSEALYVLFNAGLRVIIYPDRELLVSECKMFAKAS